MNHTLTRNSQKAAINAVSDSDAVSDNNLTRAPDTQEILQESNHPDPTSNQETSLECYITLISALVIDVDCGRIRLGSVQSADESMRIAVRLLQILDNARVWK